MEKELNSLMEDYTIKQIIYLSKKYNFELEEGLKYVNLERKESKREKEIILPFCGVINEKWCNGIRLNYGLYTQCRNDKEKKTGFCKTCIKQGERNGTGKPTYGTIEERLNAGKNYRDIKGKEPVVYGNIMKKLNISKEEAIEAARKEGLTIPEEELEVKIAKRGRPKKSVAVSDTDSEASIATPKRRGRPKKEKTIVSELATGDDIIAGLIKEAKEEAKEEENKEANKEENKEEEEVEVVIFTDPKTGIEYYKTDENVLYSMDSEPVGKWNPETEKIEELFDLDLDED